MTSEVMVLVTARRHNERMRTLLPLAALTAFSLLTIELAWKAGLSGIAVFAEPCGIQVLLDLAIACCFTGAWIRADARKLGISPTPFLLLLPLVGSIGALAYLVRRSLAKRTASSHPMVATAKAR